MTDNLSTIAKEPGVSDLPLTVRAPFAQAIKAEREGDAEKAAAKLDAAIAAEAKLN